MLKVMSFNIRGATRDDGDNVWKNRAALNVQTIFNAAPDLIGFQEMMMGNKAYYDGTLTDYDHQLGPRVSMYGDASVWEHPAIYWRRERFALLDSGSYYLSETPEQYSADWGSSTGRGLNWVRLRDLDHDIEFVFMNTHFDHVSANARLQSAHLVCRQTDKLFPDVPVILTGDFNTTPQTDPFRVLTEQHFDDAYEAKQINPKHTFHNFLGENFNSHQHPIDWILYRNIDNKLALDDVAVIRDGAPPLYPSDHYPIVATFRWNV